MELPPTTMGTDGSAQRCLDKSTEPVATTPKPGPKTNKAPREEGLAMHTFVAWRGDVPGRSVFGLERGVVRNVEGRRRG